MKSLIIQDVFEPYYADRESFAPRRKSFVAVMIEQPLPVVRPDEKPATRADKTTEH